MKISPDKIKHWLKYIHADCDLELMVAQIISFLEQNFTSVSSVTQSCPTLCDPMDCSARLPCPSPTLEAYSNSYSLSLWSHPTLWSSIVPFSSCLQSFPASGSFPVSQFFTLGGQITGVSASATVLPMNIQDWFPLKWTGWICIQSKGLLTVFSNNRVKKCHLWCSAFFVVQFSYPYIMKSFLIQVRDDSSSA